MKQLLKATHITKSYDSPNRVEVLSGIDLEVFPGTSIAIMGKSGEGKSTLLHILGSLEEPSSGSLSICGHAVSKKQLFFVRNRCLGFIFQSFYLLEEYTALDNVLMPARIGRQCVRPGSYAHQRALALLEEMGMAGRVGFPAKLLSGGEKQRTAMARALMNDPPLLFADEPSGNLDSSQAKDIHDMLLGYCAKMGKALIVATHDQELAKMADACYLLRSGRLHPLHTW